MKRFPIFLVLLVGSFMLVAADGCSSDPNVEGAKLDLNNKDYDRALENLDTALQKNPDNAEALKLKGRVLMAKSEEEREVDTHSALIVQMVEAFERAALLDPSMEIDIDQYLAIAYVKEFQLGVQAFNRGREEEHEFTTSVRHFQNAERIMPDSAGAYVNEAYALMNSGRSQEAITPFEKAMTLGDNDPETYLFLANLYLTNDRSGDAVTLLEEARGHYPDNPDIQAQLMNAYQMAGQIDRAMQVYSDAVASDPNNKLYRYNYGSLLLQTERYDEAIEHLIVATQIDDGYANAQYNLGAAYVNKAVDINERINALDDDLRANRTSLSAAEVQQREAEIDGLTDERRSIFQQAVAPLEYARTLLEAEDGDATPVCQALFQAYVQTNQQDKAQIISECAGYEDMN